MQKNKSFIAVTVTVIQNGKILLVRRKDTGFMDGYYAIPGGHLDEGESLIQGAARELKEETGLIVEEKDLELFHILQDESESPKNFFSFRFLAKKWSGKPVLAEPEKSDDIGWFDIKKLPNVSPYVGKDLEALKEKEITLGKVEDGEFDPWLRK